MAVNKNGIVVMGAVFVDIKGFPDDVYIPDGRNAGKVGVYPWRCQPERSRGYCQHGAAPDLFKYCG